MRAIDCEIVHMYVLTLLNEFKSTCARGSYTRQPRHHHFCVCIHLTVRVVIIIIVRRRVTVLCASMSIFVNVMQRLSPPDHCVATAAYSSPAPS